MNRSPALIRRLQRHETLNFWLTNRIPRRLLTTLTGRFSRIRSRRLARWSIRIWQLFADDLRLDEAETTDFDSVHACFTRRLKPGARPVDPDPDALTSPCDAVVGANGPIVRETLLQAKGMRYRLDELLGGRALAARHAGGSYVTLRLKSSMYHRFHAPCDGRIRKIGYFSGDVFNVNPPALRRIPGLFCRNERAVVPLETKHRLGPVTLVPIAAVLVASMRFAFLDESRHPARRGRHRIACDATVARGDELGWFEHGSTIVLLAGAGLVLAPGLVEGAVVRTGRPLLVPGADSSDRPAPPQSAAS